MSKKRTLKKTSTELTMNEAVTSTCVSSFNSSGEKLGCGGLKRKLKGNSENFVGNFFKKLAEKYIQIDDRSSTWA